MGVGAIITGVGVGVGVTTTGVGVGVTTVGVGVGVTTAGVGVGVTTAGVGVGVTPTGVGVGAIKTGVGVGVITTGVGVGSITPTSGEGDGVGVTVPPSSKPIRGSSADSPLQPVSMSKLAAVETMWSDLKFIISQLCIFCSSSLRICFCRSIFRRYFICENIMSDRNIYF